MKKIFVGLNNKSVSTLSDIDPTKSCTCLVCGGCLTCIVFLPVLGLSLGTGLGLFLSTTQEG